MGFFSFFPIALRIEFYEVTVKIATSECSLAAEAVSILCLHPDAGFRHSK